MEPIKNKTYSKSESNISSKTSPKNNIFNKNNNKYSNNKSNLNRNMFDFIFIIGKGGFGKVWRVKEKRTKELYALKEMSKTKIIDKKSEKSINGEREFLSYLHHPFIVNMHYAFQDHDNLYLVMDLLTGGDLRYHCSRYRSFSEEQTRFFLACIIHSLSYIHKNKVIHRDIKPENLVLDEKGYVCITDFGIAKINMPDNSSETSGTPGYMCPEVMNGKNHSFPADYFSIGVIGYEFMMGKRPYRGRGRKEIKEQMINYQAKIEEEEMKDGWSLESIDFINGLLIRKEKKRLGSLKGIKELKEHPWLKFYPWKELSNKTLPAPFIPEKIDNFDKKYCESIDEISEDTQIRYEEIMLCTHFNTAFSDFYFNKNECDRNDNIKNESEENEDTEEESVNDSEPLDKKEKNIDKDKNEQEIIINNDKNKIIKNENTNRVENKKINDEYFEKAKNKLNSIKIKKDIKNENKIILPKSNSDINLIKNKNPNNNKIAIDKPEEKRTIDNFINIKKISINCKNNNSKLNNKGIINPSKDIRDIRDIRYNLKPAKYNYLSNNLRANNPIKNVFNINNNQIHNINNNNSNINIYLSINMFNKMLNNHLIPKKKNINEKNPIQELLYKQQQLIKIENKKKALEKKFNLGHQNSYILKNINGIKSDNKMPRSNSVGMLLNQNLNFGKNNNMSRKNIVSKAFYYNNMIKNKNYNQDFLQYINKI